MVSVKQFKKRNKMKLIVDVNGIIQNMEVIKETEEYKELYNYFKENIGHLCCNKVKVIGKFKNGENCVLELQDRDVAIEDWKWKVYRGIYDGDYPLIDIEVIGNFKEEWVISNYIVSKQLVATNQYNRKITKEFEKYYPYELPKGTIILDNGNYLMNKYGKYEINLSIISKIPALNWQDIDHRNLNLPDGNTAIIYGSYFVSKKGTKCFRITSKETATHKIIKDNWGGAFSKYRGGTLPKDNAVYYRVASSNGGGMGVDYAIYPIDWIYKMSEEDI